MRLMPIVAKLVNILPISLFFCEIHFLIIYMYIYIRNASRKIIHFINFSCFYEINEVSNVFIFCYYKYYY